MHWTRSAAMLLRGTCALFLCALLVTGCQPSRQKETQTPAAVASGTALAPLPDLPVAGSTHYVVDDKASDVRILVYRGGPLAKVGHNHVLRVHDLSGDVYLVPQFHRSGFALSFPVAKLEVDPPAARAEEGSDFDTALSPQAIEATYKNMIGPAVLNGDLYPEIMLRSVALTGPATSQASVRVTLHGMTRDIPVPLAIEKHSDTLRITGVFTLRTSDFGITPFSVLGGGLQVLDEVKVRFRIAAHRNTLE